jgi:hypothetical protein
MCVAQDCDYRVGTEEEDDDAEQEERMSVKSKAKEAAVRDYLREHPKAYDREISEATGINARTVCKIRHRIGLPTNPPGFHPGTMRPHPASVKPGEREMDETLAGDQKCLTVKSCDLRTVEQVLDFAKIDTKIWRVTKVVTNSWEVTMRTGQTTRTDGDTTTSKNDVNTYTNFQIKLWLERIVPAATQDAVDSIVESMKKYAPKYPRVIVPSAKPSGDDIMLEISPFDPHLGMLAWKPETGTDWDIRIAVNVLRDAVRNILSRSGSFAIKRIVFPLGQDFYHLNSTEYVTPKAKNVLSVDGRFHKIYLSGYECMRDVIDDCLQVAPVEIKYVPGNHDQATSFVLCHALMAHYDKCKHVSVDLSPKARKAVTHGRVLLCFTHGMSEKARSLPMLFASEFREQFSRCDWFEIHTGHLHHMKEVRITTGDEHDGKTRVRILPSLASLEAYAYEAGWLHHQCAEAYLWSARDAYLGHLSVNAQAESAETEK